MRENRTRLQEFLESLMLAESYVVVAVAMPLFLIVMLVIMFWVSGAQMEESTLYAVVLLVLPMIHAMFAFIVWSTSEEQKM